MIDFDECERLRGHGYRGSGCRKLAYRVNGKVWMVKFPGTSASKSCIPLNEYIGSKVYEFLDIPVQETVLGKCQGKIVVGCRDFADRGTLLEYGQIKNMADEELISGSYGSSRQGENLSDVIRVINTSEEFEGIRNEVLQRFWDMFVVDAFICNDRRCNSDWGLLVKNEKAVLAPVFDNANAFSSDVSFFLDDSDRKISPFVYLRESGECECRKALLRFLSQFDLNEINKWIADIPEKAFGLPVMNTEQKQFYIDMLTRNFEENILPICKMNLKIM